MKVTSSYVYAMLQYIRTYLSLESNATSLYNGRSSSY